MDIKQKGFAMFLVLLIVLNTGYVVFQNNYSTVTVFTLAMVSVYLFIYHKYVIYDFKLLAIIFLITIILFDIIIYGDFNFSHYLGLSITIISSVIVSTVISLKDFCKYYNRIIFYLSLISIPFFLLGYLLPHVVESLPTINYLLNSGETGYKNGILYLYRYDPRLDFQTGFTKNNSIFWEPGAYQALLNLALIFEIKAENSNRFRLLIYTICLITTFSTTGILSGILILTATLALRKTRHKFNINFLSILIILILVSIILYFNANLIFGKLFQGNTSHASFLERYSGTMNDIAVFNSSNFLGIGYTEFGLQGFGSSNGITSTFAKYGLIFGSIILMGLISFISKITKEFFETIIYILIFTIMLATEAFMIKPLFFLMMFYGFGLYGSFDKESEEVSYG
ncbi:hypothetical protein OSC52_03625 [Clostridium pasteurianum]|uniref:hypothetical protein n=1 Tax=Clostridium pasteurianum TaxID=1501 RepID=UPI0022608850|nr:hypothetical protein [Clostridium pasteurianum]UZW14944.1 hypothetical protein OSC52_03625 [Clostridium pasteurianum]